MRRCGRPVVSLQRPTDASVHSRISSGSLSLSLCRLFVATHVVCFARGAETQLSRTKTVANEEKAADLRYQHQEEQKYRQQEHGECNESLVRLQLVRISSS